LTDSANYLQRAEHSGLRRECLENLGLMGCPSGPR
jgi:hypothetical protein